jgi:plasmid stabilization system protein ParE
MSKYRFTPQALDDLFEIWSFIARDNLPAADRVEEAVYQACALLGESPFAGHARKDLTRLPVRFWSVPGYSNYLIVYDPENRPVRVIRILHGARNVPEVLGSERE